MMPTLRLVLRFVITTTLVASAQQWDCQEGKPEASIGTIEDGGFRASIAGESLVPNNNSTVVRPLSTGSHVLQVNGNFRNIFMRFEGPPATGGALVLIPFVNVKDATSICRASDQPSVVKAVQESSPDQPLALTTFLSNVPIAALHVEITVTVSSADVGEFETYYSSYLLSLGSGDEIPHPTAVPAPSPSVPTPPTAPGPCFSAQQEARICRDFRMIASKSQACGGCVDTSFGQEWLDDVTSCESARSSLCQSIYEDCDCEPCVEEQIAWKTCEVDDALDETCPIVCYAPDTSAQPTRSPTFAPTLPPTGPPVPTTPVPTVDPNQIDCSTVEADLQVCFSDNLEINQIISCSTCISAALGDTSIIGSLFDGSDCTEISHLICSSYEECGICHPCIPQLVAQTSCELKSQSALPDGCHLDCDATFAPAVTPAPMGTSAPSTTGAPTPEGGPCAPDLEAAVECLTSTALDDGAGGNVCLDCVDSNMMQAVLGDIEFGCDSVVFAMCSVFNSCSCDPCIEPMFRAVQCEFEQNAETFPALDLTCAANCSVATAPPFLSPQSDGGMNPTPAPKDRSPPEDPTAGEPTASPVAAIPVTTSVSAPLLQMTHSLITVLVLAAAGL